METKSSTHVNLDYDPRYCAGQEFEQDHFSSCNDGEVEQLKYLQSEDDGMYFSGWKTHTIQYQRLEGSD